MNSYTHVTKINYDKLLIFFVTLIIIGYLVVLTLKTFNFNDLKETVSSFNSLLINDTIIEYLNNHDNYYYKIEGSIYCITIDELKNSNEIPDNIIKNLEGNMIEATYQDKSFTIKYNDNCIEK